MPVVYSYIPAPLAALQEWADNFRDVLVASPGSYFLTPTDAAAVAVVVDDFDAAYALSAKTSPATRTPATVAATVTAKATMLMLLRTLASQIRLNPGVTDADKITLGLRLPNNNPSPVPTPTTYPLLTIDSYAPLQHNIRFADSSTPDLKAKPAGSIGLQIWRGVGVAPITDPALCSWLDQVTKQPYLSVFLPGDAGKIATYFARWIGRGAAVGGASARFGPWSSNMTAGVAS